MRTRFVGALLASFTILAAGGACASGGGGPSGDVYREDLGRVLSLPLQEARQKIWTKHGIPVEREEKTSRSLRVQSQWMLRQPEPAEAAEGVTQARNQIILTGRLLEGQMDYSDGVLRVTFEVSNQVRSEAVPEWHPAPMPSAIRDEFRKVYSDMRLEVGTGVRR